ncbi:hypothetical protein SAMN05518672_11576 [Chitinophaga sp. CF118]|nr:hypothetical protein SAMN05518672_11576 [Chitinophaga sp. CF118]
MLALLSLFLYNGSNAQRLNVINMELENIIDSQDKMVNFISTNFFDHNISNQELAINNHSMFSYKFNRALTLPFIDYTLFGLKINDQFAYQINNDKFCLYLLMDIDKDALDIVVNRLGHPANVTSEDYETGDFDFLAWHKKGIDLTIMKDRMSTMREPEKLKINLLITNMDYRDLISTEKIF